MDKQQTEEVYEMIPGDGDWISISELRAARPDDIFLDDAVWFLESVGAIYGTEDDDDVLHYTRVREDGTVKRS